MASRALVIGFDADDTLWHNENIFEKTHERYRALLQRVAEGFGGSVTVFDPTPILCDESAGVCGHVKNGVRLYSYTDHPSDDAADLIGSELNAYLAQL